jgi:hypothetical protein
VGEHRRIEAEVLLAGPIGRETRYELRTSGPFTPREFRRLIRALRLVAEIWEEEEPSPPPQPGRGAEDAGGTVEGRTA